MDLDSYSTEFEGRRYVDPNVSLNEQLGFIDQLRNVQAQNNQEVKADTYNLGTAVPSNLGGLIGGEGYFTSRYQVPQTVALTNELRATAQAPALTQALQNEQAKWKQRYQRAYDAARRRAASGSGSGDGTGGDAGYSGLGVDVNSGATQTLPYSPATNLGTGRMNQDDKGTYYLAADGTKYYVGEFTALDDLLGPGGFSIQPNRQNGEVFSMGGRDYIYYADPQSQGGGSYFPVTSVEGS